MPLAESEAQRQRTMGEQFNVMLGTVPRHSIHSHYFFPLSSAGVCPRGSTATAEGTQKFTSWMEWPQAKMA